jgi:AraC-like DNA-binding protein
VLDPQPIPFDPLAIELELPSLPSKPLKAFPSRLLRLAQRVWIQQVSYPPQAFAVRGKMESFEFLWVYDGVVEYAEGRPAGVNDLVLLRPGKRYIFSTGQRSARALSVQFRVDVYPRVWGKPADWPLHRALPEGDICRPLLSFLLAQAPQRDSFVVRPALMALIAAFVTGKLSTAAPNLRPLSSGVLAAIAFIRSEIAKQPHRRFTMTEVADTARTPYSTLLGHFHKYLGQTPRACIMRARLDRAVELMRRTDLPIEQIAVLTGFCNQAHLYKWCKSEFGLNPRPLRLVLCDGEHPMPLPRSPMLAGPTFGHFPAYDPSLAKPIARRRKGFISRLSRLVTGERGRKRASRSTSA